MSICTSETAGIAWTWTIVMAIYIYHIESSVIIALVAACQAESLLGSVVAVVHREVNDVESA